MPWRLLSDDSAADAWRGSAAAAHTAAAAKTELQRMMSMVPDLFGSSRATWQIDSALPSMVFCATLNYVNDQK